MTQGIIKSDPGFVEVIGKGGFKFPFITEVQLLECYVAGTTFREYIEEIEPDLQKDDLLVLKREPENEHDGLAIAVYDKKERLVGYIPRKKNEVLAHLMDAGKVMFGKIESKEWQGRWLKINVLVYMRDMYDNFVIKV